MKRTFIAAAAALSLGATLAQATVIESAYTSLGGDAWLVDFRIINDGVPASFAGFSIDFPNATNLMLVASPLTWDSAVFQPDAGIPDDGFLDSFVIEASNGLGLGQTLGGFQVSFNYAAGLAPGALPFVINDANFAPLAMGLTSVTAVPEPTTMLLAAFGLGVVALRTAHGRRPQRATEEVGA